MEAIQRNFGGYFGDLQPAREVLSKLQDAEMIQIDMIASKELILRALEEPDNPTETRYLLLLTKNNAALRIIEEHDLIEADHSVIYGSSFPHDQGLYGKFAFSDRHWLFSLLLISQLVSLKKGCLFKN